MNLWTIPVGLKLQIESDETPLGAKRYTLDHVGTRTYIPICKFDVDGNLHLRGGLITNAGDEL